MLSTEQILELNTNLFNFTNYNWKGMITYEHPSIAAYNELKTVLGTLFAKDIQFELKSNTLKNREGVVVKELTDYILVRSFGKEYDTLSFESIVRLVSKYTGKALLVLDSYSKLVDPLVSDEFPIREPYRAVLKATEGTLDSFIIYKGNMVPDFTKPEVYEIRK